MTSNAKPGTRAVPIVQNGQPAKWTEHKLWAEMRAVGWQALGQGVWTHPDCPGYQLQLFAYDAANGRELWHRYAEERAVPRAEDFI